MVGPAMNQKDAKQCAQGVTAVKYETAVFRFQQLAAEEAEIVSETGGSILLTHGKRTSRAYILVHGTTNSPTQLLEYGRHFLNLGHNVYIPRMPYHGLRSGQVSELAQLTAIDLRTFGHDVVDIGAGLGDELVLIGASGGATVAAWVAVNCPQVKRTLLLVPFFGFYGLPDKLTLLIMKLLLRLPDRAVYRPSEKHRPWAYPGQSTRGIAAYLVLAREVLGEAEEGFTPDGDIIIITTANDNLANNGTTARLVEMWQRAGTDVEHFEFERAWLIPHNTVDPAADPEVRQQVFRKMLVLLGEVDQDGKRL
jgi:pimeloyl-ACP methyl ester carboxylesterase